jgi:hypothetical protein
VRHKDHDKEGSYTSQAKKPYQAEINAFSGKFSCLLVGSYDGYLINLLIFLVKFIKGREKSETPDRLG